MVRSKGVMVDFRVKKLRILNKWGETTGCKDAKKKNSQTVF